MTQLLRKPTDEEVEIINKKVDEWTGVRWFDDARGVALIAVKEYVANQYDITLFRTPTVEIKDLPYIKRIHIPVEDDDMFSRPIPDGTLEYNPDYGDDRMCKCGHSYYRHFDTYDDMYPIGCKYCDCDNFEEK